MTARSFVLAVVLGSLSLSAIADQSPSKSAYTPASLAKAAAGAVRYADERARHEVQSIYFDCSILLRRRDFEGRVVSLESILMVGAMQAGFGSGGKKTPYYSARDRSDVIAVDMHQLNSQTGKIDSWNSFSIDKESGRLIRFGVPDAAIGNACMGGMGNVYVDLKPRSEPIRAPALAEKRSDPPPADDPATIAAAAIARGLNWVFVDKGPDKCVLTGVKDPELWVKAATQKVVILSAHTFADGDTAITYQMPNGMDAIFTSTMNRCNDILTVGNGKRGGG